MKTLLVAALVVIASSRSLAADLLGGAVEITPAEGWAATPAAPARMPTLSYAPQGSDDARISISLFRSADVGVRDGVTLLQFHRKLCRGYGDAKPVVPLTQFKTPAGEGVSVTYEDPSLAGKPVPDGEYRMSTVVCTFLTPEFVTYSTVLTNEAPGSLYDAGVAMAKSGKIIAIAQRLIAPAPVISFRDLGAELQLPPGFRRVNERARGSPHYFYFENGRVRLSGWLEPAAMYRKNKSFTAFWANERKAMEKSGKIALSAESLKDIAGWSVALYRASIPGVPACQRNLRACRVVGDTWADVHLSTPLESPDFGDLEAALESLVLRPKTEAKLLRN